jgi:WD40 repeat protein
MSETLELIACAGTSDKYWLVYPYRSDANNYSSNEMRVRRVNVGAPNADQIVGPVHSTCPKIINPTYSIASSRQHNRIAVANLSNKTVDVFNFDKATGVISRRDSIYGFNAGSALYGVEFSPDGNQLYVTGWNAGDQVQFYQYDLLTAGTLEVGRALHGQDEYELFCHDRQYCRLQPRRHPGSVCGQPHLLAGDGQSALRRRPGMESRS